MNNFAHLREDSPFYPLFDKGLVPIINIIVPNVAECEGDGVQDVYMVALDKLSPEQFEALIRLVRQQCGPEWPLEVVRKEIKARGLPLRAKHVTGVSSDAPFFL